MLPQSSDGYRDLSAYQPPVSKSITTQSTNAFSENLAKDFFMRQQMPTYVSRQEAVKHPSLHSQFPLHLSQNRAMPSIRADLPDALRNGPHYNIINYHSSDPRLVSGQLHLGRQVYPSQTVPSQIIDNNSCQTNAPNHSNTQPALNLSNNQKLPTSTQKEGIKSAVNSKTRCNLCFKEAQFLCSTCKHVCYCSTECQVSHQ